MQARLKRFIENVRKSISGARLALARPKYIFIAIILAFVLSAIIYLSINFGFYGALLTSRLPLLDKLGTIGVLLQSMLSSYFADFNGVLLLLLSLLQGIVLSLLIYNFRHNKKLDKKVVAGSGISAIIAAIGLGCVPCGTSLLIPIMTLFFSSSAYLFLDAANAIILLLAIILSVYSAFKLGLIIHINRITNQWKKEKKS